MSLVCGMENLQVFPISCLETVKGEVWRNYDLEQRIDLCLIS